MKGEKEGKARTEVVGKGKKMKKKQTERKGFRDSTTDDLGMCSYPSDWDGVGTCGSSPANGHSLLYGTSKWTQSGMVSEHRLNAGNLGATP
jgi:hypothetical protein